MHGLRVRCFELEDELAALRASQGGDGGELDWLARTRTSVNHSEPDTSHDGGWYCMRGGYPVPPTGEYWPTPHTAITAAKEFDASTTPLETPQ